MSCKDKDKAGNIKILHTGFYAGHNAVYTLYIHNPPRSACAFCKLHVTIRCKARKKYIKTDVPIVFY